MNWPNRLTIMRIALIPVLVLCLYIDTGWARVLALVVFLAASFTDWLDGWMARKYEIVTNFGKFLDPVADKLLVLSTLIALCGRGVFPAWACIVILFRELAVDGLRLVAMEQGRVIAAGKLGKLKTTVQMLTIVVFLLACGGVNVPPYLPEIMMWLTIALTIWSGADYFVKNRQALAGGGRLDHDA